MNLPNLQRYFQYTDFYFVLCFVTFCSSNLYFKHYCWYFHSGRSFMLLFNHHIDTPFHTNIIPISLRIYWPLVSLNVMELIVIYLEIRTSRDLAQAYTVKHYTHFEQHSKVPVIFMKSACRACTIQYTSLQLLQLLVFQSALVQIMPNISPTHTLTRQPPPLSHPPGLNEVLV